MVEKVGKIEFGSRILNVYDSLDTPLFMVKEIAETIDYSRGNTWALTNLCEEDEKLELTVIVAGQRRAVSFVNENGLYNILAQSRTVTARKWRRVVHNELIKMRKQRGKNIIEQFEEWDHELDSVYFDHDKGIFMQSITVAGGDVIQVPYEKEK